MVYLAQPAPDMRPAYARLRAELEGRGYTVVPDADAKIPPESAAAAEAFVDESLRIAEASIHLIGNMRGYQPDGGVPIVQLQLCRAAKRQGEKIAGVPSFRRIVWAPRVFVEDASATVGDSAERDPLAVMTKLDDVRDDDKIDGSELSKFVEFVTQHLKRQEPVGSTPLRALESDSRVFVYHAEEDTDYAIELAQALEEQRVEPVLPIFEGDPVEIEAWRRDRLRECDAIVICWARTTEIWARSHTPEFRDWSKLGREQQFRCRTLVLGPPPGGRKGVLLRLQPRRDVDVVLDLTGCEHLTSDAIHPILESAAAGGV
ncbi:MAG TPA: hypothetical protein VK669_12820 [Candidatus Limnocylindrales bacterium]|nr:hypothetical protein [Candidatus Limnocylindrales bacterium]